MMWKKGIWTVKHSFSVDEFVGVCVEFHSKVFFFVNNDPPCSTASRRLLWENLCKLKFASSEGEWCLMGDFYVVSSFDERMGKNAYLRYKDIVEFNVLWIV